METSRVTTAHVMTYLMRKDVSTRKTTQHSILTLMQPIVFNTEEPLVRDPEVETQVLKDVSMKMPPTTILLQQFNR